MHVLVAPQVVVALWHHQSKTRPWEMLPVPCWRPLGHHGMAVTLSPAAPEGVTTSQCHGESTDPAGATHAVPCLQHHAGPHVTHLPPCPHVIHLPPYPHRICCRADPQHSPCSLCAFPVPLSSSPCPGLPPWGHSLQQTWGNPWATCAPVCKQLWTCLMSNWRAELKEGEAPGLNFHVGCFIAEKCLLTAGDMCALSAPGLSPAACKGMGQEVPLPSLVPCSQPRNSPQNKGGQPRLAWDLLDQRRLDVVSSSSQQNKKPNHFSSGPRDISEQASRLFAL